MVETRTFWEWDADGVKRGERTYVLQSDYDRLHEVIDANERALIAAADRIAQLEAALMKLCQTCNGELGCKGYRVDEDLGLTAPERD